MDSPIQVNTLIKSCRACKNRKRYTLGYGNKESKIMFVLQNPSPKHPDFNHVVACLDCDVQPKRGTGWMLEEALKILGYKKQDFYYTNIVKCSHIESYIPDDEMIENCQRFFIQEISEMKNLKLILLLGGKTTKVFDLYNKTNKDFFKDYIIKAIYHPALYLRRHQDPKDYAMILERVIKCC